jgi:hypothetical protein
MYDYKVEEEVHELLMNVDDVELEYRKPSKYTTSAVTCRASEKASNSTEFDSLHGAPPQYPSPPSLACHV